MVFITGDKHGEYAEVEEFCAKHNTNTGDVLIVLGDNGVNFFGGRRDRRAKAKLAAMPITFFMIRGNHDQRPSRKVCHESFYSTDQMAGVVLVEDEYPNILYAIDGEIYSIMEANALVAGGAYSIDKQYRLELMEQGFTGYRWFPDEQLTKNERAAILEIARKNHPDIILSHTCPYSMAPWGEGRKPAEESDVTMERWMDKVDAAAGEPKWYCGHWHLDKNCGFRPCFMYHNIIEFEV